MDAVWNYLERARREHPGGEAVVHGEARWSWEELHRRALGLAAFLEARGVSPGQRVALLWENSPGYVQAYFALHRLGAIVVGLNPVNDAAYVMRVCADCEPAVLVGQAKFMRRIAGDLDPARVPPLWLLDAPLDAPPAGTRVEPLGEESGKPRAAPPGPGDDAMILYTSGTTGRPKGVTLTQRNLTANTESIVEYLALTREDRVMVVLPFFYSYGHSLLLTHAAVGGTLVVDNRFAFPRVVLETMEREGVTGISGVPSTYAILMQKTRLDEHPLPALRYFTIAGGGLPVADLQRLRGLWPGVTPFVMYGQTEGTARLSYLDPAELDRKLGSIGRGIPGVRLEVLDEEGRPTPPGVTGEIVASGENIMRGYWRDPEETRRVVDERGRLWTGDLARVDEDGYLFVVGRKKDMIKSGGYRINPKEIEDHIAELPAVVMSAVLGLPDSIHGERIVACIVARAGEGLAAADVTRHLRGCLPHWKQPHEVRFVEDLPRTSSGKIQKHILRESLEGGGMAAAGGPRPAGEAEA